MNLRAGWWRTDRGLVAGGVVFLPLYLTLCHVERFPALLYLLFGLTPFIGCIYIIAWTHRLRKRRVSGEPPFVFAWVVMTYLVFTSYYAGAYKAASGLGSQVLYRGTEPASDLGVFSYYSIVTASTLGYGDYSPKGVLTRILSCVEVIQFWVLLALAVYTVHECVGKAQETSLAAPHGGT